MTTLLLIRHGLTDAVDRLLAGSSPGHHLNEDGRRQAAELSRRLRDAPLTAVVSSPLERAVETAQPIAESHALDLSLALDLSEFECGDWTGTTMTTLEARAEWQRFNTVRSLVRVPGGELMLEVQQRAVNALLRLHAGAGNGTIAVVSHGDVIRAALMYFLGMPIDFLHRIRIDPCRVSVVDLTEWQPVVRQVNGDSVPPRA